MAASDYAIITPQIRSCAEGGVHRGKADLRDTGQPALVRPSLVAIAASLGLGIPGVGSADVLACLPWVRTHVYEHRTFVVSGDEAKRLHVNLERHSGEIGLSYASVGGYDPYKRPPVRSMDSILQSESVATVIEVRTSSRSRYAKVTVGNNCFESKEDWRPYWTKFNRLLDRLGYGK